MRRRNVAAVVLISALVLGFGGLDRCCGEPFMPHAPAGLSWLPHGYGGDMDLINSGISTQKGAHGFRISPAYIGCWSQPLWGWDVTGYYRGPNAPCPDPGMVQLPIGLIYPDNGPSVPPAPKPISKVSGR